MRKLLQSEMIEKKNMEGDIKKKLNKSSEGRITIAERQYENHWSSWKTDKPILWRDIS